MTTNKTINEGVGLANIITDQLKFAGCIKMGKHDKATIIALQCILTHTYKPRLSKEYGEMLVDSLTDDGRLDLHRLEQDIVRRINKVDDLLRED